jgi:hypothetical protein
LLHSFFCTQFSGLDQVAVATINGDCINSDSSKHPTPQSLFSVTFFATKPVIFPGLQQTPVRHYRIGIFSINRFHFFHALTTHFHFFSLLFFECSFSRDQLLRFLFPDIDREFAGTDFINVQYSINMGAQQINGLVPGLNQLIAATPG